MRSRVTRASANDTTLEALGGLRALFAADGTVTAGNSSPINDGASAILLGAEGVLDAEPLARITGRGVFGNDPDVFGVAPVEAANRALARAGRTWADVDFVELNEAFASQSLACLQLWPELDPEKVNIHGGAIAIGHPLGASGGRIIGHAAHELARRGGGVAVAAICIGVGQGLAVVLGERPVSRRRRAAECRLRLRLGVARTGVSWCGRPSQPGSAVGSAAVRTDW